MGEVYIYRVGLCRSSLFFFCGGVSVRVSVRHVKLAAKIIYHSDAWKWIPFFCIVWVSCAPHDNSFCDWVWETHPNRDAEAIRVVAPDDDHDRVLWSWVTFFGSCETARCDCICCAARLWTTWQSFVNVFCARNRRCAEFWNTTTGRKGRGVYAVRKLFNLVQQIESNTLRVRFVVGTWETLRCVFWVIWLK